MIQTLTDEPAACTCGKRGGAHRSLAEQGPIELSLLHINAHYHQSCENVSHDADHVHLVVDTRWISFSSCIIRLHLFFPQACAGAT
jgi:hypothetical protein